MPSRRAFSAYQRCGIELRPCTASTSACTDSSLGLVREVAARDPAVEVAQPVVDRLVGEQRVQHERPRAQPRLEPRGDRFGGGAPHVAVGRVQPAERGLERRRSRRRARSQMLDTCSSNRRSNALRPVIAFSVRITSSGSVSRCGPVAALRAQVVARRTRAGRRRAASRPARRAARPTRGRRTGAWC